MYTLFLQHEYCPKCGSRDNLGRWDDGHGWCFGCGYYEPPQIHRSITQTPEKVKTCYNDLIMPPDDISKCIGIKGWTWLKKYGILESEVNDCFWSDSKQWLIFPIYSKLARKDYNKDILIAWQARNFDPIRYKPKYITHGQIGDIIHLYGKESDTVVLVEDILSAIKVGRSQHQSMPMFGSNISLKTLTRLAKRFKKLGIWLDMDKAKESLKSKLRASQLGFDQVFTIITPKDPKEYSDEEIKMKLQGY